MLPRSPSGLFFKTGTRKPNNTNGRLSELGSLFELRDSVLTHAAHIVEPMNHTYTCFVNAKMSKTLAQREGMSL